MSNVKIIKKNDCNKHKVEKFEPMEFVKELIDMSESIFELPKCNRRISIGTDPVWVDNTGSNPFVWPEWPASSNPTWNPVGTNIYSSKIHIGYREYTDEDNNLYFEFDAAGLKKEDINITVENGKILLEAPRKFKDSKFKDITYLASIVKENIDYDTIDANYENGVINIKFKLKNNVKKIQVK